MEINYFTVLAQIANFGILMVILRKYLFRPILSRLKERQDFIKREQDSINALKSDLQVKEKILDEKLKEMDTKKKELNEELTQKYRKKEEDQNKLLDLEFQVKLKLQENELAKEKQKIQEALKEDITSITINAFRKLLEKISSESLFQICEKKFIEKFQKNLHDEKIISCSSTNPITDIIIFEILKKNKIEPLKLQGKIMGLEMVTINGTYSFYLDDITDSIEEELL